MSRFPTPTAVGGEFAYRFDPEWLDVEPSHLATERTYVEFQGRTAYGDRSEFPFYARSADWQESDRLLAGIITAFGSPTGVDHRRRLGEFRGTMTKSFRARSSRGSSSATTCGRGTSSGGARPAACRSRTATSTSRAVVTRGPSSIAVGRPVLARLPAQGRRRGDQRPGRAQGPADARPAARLPARRLAGRRAACRASSASTAGTRGPSATAGCPSPTPRRGASRSTARAPRCGSRATASGSTRWRSRRAAGTITGAAYVGWDGTYSFDVSGERIPLDTVASLKFGTVEWSGQMHFNAEGASTFTSPRYDVQMGADDVSVGGEAIGAVAMRLRRQGAPAHDRPARGGRARRVRGRARSRCRDTIGRGAASGSTGRCSIPTCGSSSRASRRTRARWSAAPSASSASSPTGTGCRPARRSTSSTSACSTTRSGTTGRCGWRSRTTSRRRAQRLKLARQGHAARGVRRRARPRRRTAST